MGGEKDVQRDKGPSGPRARDPWNGDGGDGGGGRRHYHSNVRCIDVKEAQATGGGGVLRQELAILRCFWRGAC